MNIEDAGTAAPVERLVRLPSYYDRDGIELYCGDNCDVLGTMPRDCVDLVVTSPPYDDLRTYGGHSWDFYGVAWQLKRVLKPSGVILWVVNDKTEDGDETGTSMRQALHFKEIGLRLHDTMIYEKQNPGGARGSNLAYWQVFETMFVFAKGQPATFNPIEDRRNAKAGVVYRGGGRRNCDGSLTQTKLMETPEYGRRGNIWRYAVGGDNNGHPAPFPEQLARDHILSWSNEGDIVLDPFSGSGTTVKMAREMGRRGIGIEINQEYCDIAVKRLQQRLLFGGMDATAESA